MLQLIRLMRPSKDGPARLVALHNRQLNNLPMTQRCIGIMVMGDKMRRLRQLGSKRDLKPLSHIRQVILQVIPPTLTPHMPSILVHPLNQGCHRCRLRPSRCSTDLNIPTLPLQ